MPKSPARIYLLSMLAIASVVATCGSAEARKEEPPSFFSKPLSQQDTAPKFKGTADAVAPSSQMGADGEIPRRDILNRLPSLKQDQRKAINTLIGSIDKQLVPINNQINDLKDRLAELKKTSAEKPGVEKAKASLTNQAIGQLASSAMPPATYGPATPGFSPEVAPAPPMTEKEITDQIEALRKIKKAAVAEASKQLTGILTADQFLELDAMRNGTLVIDDPANSLWDEKK